MLPAVVPKPALPLTPGWDDAVAAMNEHHAIIDNVGGKTVIACWEPSSLDPAKLVVVFQNKESFLLRYSNRYAMIDIPDGKGGGRQMSVALGKWWLDHRQRRQYRGVTFLPAGPKEVNQCLNLWQDWGVEPKAGDWSLIREHIEVVLASGNKEFADYIIRWIAWSIQNPAAQAEVALVLIGAKGAGKGTLVRCLKRIFGAHAFQVTSREHVIDKFNGHLQDCVLFVADEAYWGGDKRCVGRLQGMITEPTLPIERKGLDVFEVRNFLHIVMLAEPGWVIPAGRYERRYAAIAVSTVKRGDRGYFRALYRQIEEGGAEAMFYDLQRMDLESWHPRYIPEALLTNPALQKQQSHNLPPLEQWYVMLLHNGVLPGALSKRPNTAFTTSLVDDAKSKVPRLGDLSDVALRNFLLDEEALGVV
jgi:Mesyanzhinovviridae DNA primase